MTSNEALQTLIHADAYLLATFGPKGLLKEGPEKQASQVLEMATRKVLRAVIRERAAELSSKSVEQIEVESTEAINAWHSDELPVKDVTKREEKQNNDERMVTCGD